MTIKYFLLISFKSIIALHFTVRSIIQPPQVAELINNPPANAGDLGSVSGSGRSPGGGNGKLLQSSCLADSTDRGAWWTTVHRAAKESNKTDHTWTCGFSVIYLKLTFAYGLK